MQKFKQLIKLAEKRKGGAKVLQTLMPKVPSARSVAKKSDDRFLSMMTKCINRAGFHWGVIDKKWPQFEEAYLDFNLQKLSRLSDEHWEAYLQDTRVVRNWQKIKATKDNLYFVLDTAAEHGSFAKFIANWPADDQVGLMLFLKKNGSRLGGYTGQHFLRNMGKDAFVLSNDVVIALQNAGANIQDNPTSKKDLTLIQQVFNDWHAESGLPYTHISKIAAYSAGTNYSADEILAYMEE